MCNWRPVSMKREYINNVANECHRPTRRRVNWCSYTKCNDVAYFIMAFGLETETTFIDIDTSLFLFVLSIVGH